MTTKPWYQSKTIWAALAAALSGIYSTLAVAHNLPPIPSWVTSLFGAGAIYGRVVAVTKIA